MMNIFVVFKSLHVIFVICWMAGLLYIGRLFVYAQEAYQDTDEQRKNILLLQYHIMKKRLWYMITYPAAILSLIFGIMLIWLQYSEGLPDWLYVKLGFVMILIIYHFFCHTILLQQSKGVFKWSSKILRMYNEIPTILMFVIVFLVMTKTVIGLFWAMGTVVFIFIITLLIIKINKILKKQ